MRILALDWGTVRIGAAVSDEQGIIAFPLEKPFGPNEFAEIKRFAEEKEVKKIILGKPLTLSGNVGASAKEVENFKADLESKLNLPVEYFDERFSTVAAQKLLNQQGTSSKDQRLVRDNLAAQAMLETYLDARNQKKDHFK